MHVMAYAPWGAEGVIIRVEADIRRGIPGVDITGLAEGAVREARERVRAAFRNSGYTFPADRILINLAPAGVKKEGASLDLPIALAVMSAAGLAPSAENLMVLGELELSGKLRPVRGVLAATAAGLKAGIKDFIVPEENAAEAAILAAGHVCPASTLAEAVHALIVREETGALPVGNFPLDKTSEKGIPQSQYIGDFAEVRGQSRYKRTLEIAAAGGHNLLAFGPPGAGKTMLARRLPTIMAPLETGEAVEVTRLHSLAGQTLGGQAFGGGLITRPPFRSPHHSASAEGILGGGKSVRPGEISLAHFGALFLDEAPEFRSNVLQSLREPLEDRVITISRAEGPVRLPADFQLLLAANPCPCGRLGKPVGEENPAGQENHDHQHSAVLSPGCFCAPQEIYRYWRKFGGALLDRVELRAAVPAPSIRLMEQGREESSAAIARRVFAAVAIQRDRFKKTGLRRNARIPAGEIERLCPLTEGAQKALRQASEKLGLSGRAYHGILRTGRTIADLEGKDIIEAVHILEAVQHRRLGEDPYDIFSIDAD